MVLVVLLIAGPLLSASLDLFFLHLQFFLQFVHEAVFSYRTFRLLIRTKDFNFVLHLFFGEAFLEVPLTNRAVEIRDVVFDDVQGLQLMLRKA